MPTLTIDNIKVEVPDGTTILQAARQAGVEVPTLCYVEDLQAIGACRVCLVEVEGAKALVASCATPVAEGMDVKTNTPRARKARQTVVELLLSEHNGDCQTCDRNEDCELQTLARDLGIGEIGYAGEKTAKRSTTPRPPWCATPASASSAAAASGSASRPRTSAPCSRRTAASTR